MSQSHILVVDDEPDIRDLVQEILEDEGYRVTTAENGESARAAFARLPPDLVLLDIWMPDVDGITLLREWSAGGLPCPVVVMSGHGTVETAIEATRLGAHDFVQKPISLARLLAVVEQALEQAQEQARGRQRPAAPAAAIEPLGGSAAIQALRRKAEQAAQHDLPVLITGEKGSGRESLARFIHRRSGRAGAFVMVDLCRLEGDACRAYLLGDDRAEPRQPGVFEQARGGTLFLPELQDLPPEALKILDQAIESGHFEGDGGGTQELDCRLVASARDDLIQRAQKEAALQQLYFRLNVLPLQVPPLRERPEDIPDLVRHYADWFPNNENLPYRAFSVAAQNRLRNHRWPGNMRELRNLVQRLLVLGGEGEVTAAEVDEALRESPTEAADARGGYPDLFELPLREAREQFEREYLAFKLREAGGSVGKLAEAVGMERTHLYRKLRALGVDPKTAAADGEPG